MKKIAFDFTNTPPQTGECYCSSSGKCGTVGRLIHAVAREDAEAGRRHSPQAGAEGG